MHIAVDALLLKNQNGGTGFYTRHLLIALAQIAPQHRFTVFLGEDYTSATAFDCANISLQKQYFKNSAHRVVWEQTALVARLNRLKPDVLFCPFFVKPLCYLGKTVVTMHDVYHRVAPKSMRPDRLLYRRFFIDQSAFQAAHLIAISKCTKSDIETHYGISDKKISVVYNGVDETFRKTVEIAHREQVLKYYQIDYPEFLFSVSTLHRNKNFGQLLESLWRLKLSGKIFPLVIAGGQGDDSQRLVDLVNRFELQKQVRFIGFVSDAHLSALYQSAKIFIIPSLYEGFGLPLLEAMASGTPTIYARRGALPEIAGGAGLSFLTTEELSDALSLLWNDASLRSRFIQAGLQHSARFSWRETAKETLAVFERLS